MGPDHGAAMTGYSYRDIPRYLTGLSAMAVALVVLQRADTLPILLASVFFFLICATDTFLSEIPNPINLALALAGAGYHVHTAGAGGLLTAFCGLLVGFALLFLPYLFGGMGAGDVKALAALGALLGPAPVFQVFLYAGLIGGGIAVLHYAFHHNPKTTCLRGVSLLKTFAYTHDVGLFKPQGKGEGLRFPYAAAIAFGFFAYIRWGILI